MPLSVEQCLEQIRTHTRALAAAAEGRLDRRIEHCPDWSMADLVWHLTEVHRFWDHIASERPSAPPEDLDQPGRPADDELVPDLLTGMETLLATLGAADQTAPCWTWGPQENVGFITRHQVQEAAVHHFDAATAAGQPWAMDAIPAMDAIEEFLTCSVANAKWPMPDAEPIGGTVWFRAAGEHAVRPGAVFVSDSAQPGIVQVETDLDAPATELAVGADGDPATFLLWLYRRVPDDAVFTDADADSRAVLDRFRALASTD